MIQATVLVVFAAVLACGCAQKQAAKAAEPADADVSAVKRRIEEKISVQGVVRSEQRVELRSERELKVAEVKVKDFQAVKKGEVLVTIDTKETVKKRQEIVDQQKSQELQMRSARSKFKNVKKNLDRKRELLMKGIIAETDYEKAQAEYEAASTDIKTKELEAGKTERNLAEIDAQVKAANFVAPIDGVVSELVQAGADAISSTSVGAGKLVAVVSDPAKLALWVKVSELWVHRMKLAMPASVKLDALPDARLASKLAQIGTNPVQGFGGGPFKEYEVAVAFEAPDGGDIREGFQGTAEIVFDAKDDAVTVPLAAVKYENGRNLVLVAVGKDRAPEPRPVDVGLKTDTEIEIVKGLAEGERVVVK